MSVKRCLLHGRYIGSLDELYDQLARSLPIPDYFGRNLDALWDVLSTDIEGPLQIVWEDSADSKKRMGHDFERVVSLLKNLKRERDDVEIILK